MYAVLKQRGHDPIKLDPWYYPSPDEYSDVLVFFPKHLPHRSESNHIAFLAPRSRRIHRQRDRSPPVHRVSPKRLVRMASSVLTRDGLGRLL